MYYNSKEVEKFSIQASDGELGSVDDFYFDDENWAVRYLVADTSKWLPGRKVLLSPMAMKGLDNSEKHVVVNESKDKVKDSPDIDTAQPVSRRHEAELNQYWGWNYYWAGSGTWGPYAVPSQLALADSRVQDGYENHERLENEAGSEEETSLRSHNEITSYHIHAEDGEIGHISSFIFDDESWEVKYFVIDTRNWWPGKHVLIKPEWIRDIDFADSLVSVRLTKETIKSGPQYEEGDEITPELEREVDKMEAS
ncbi:PRC-barrel domain-containing protein [Bacillus marinisedimentorum]|uniref:PRC-barrel domain-containing protein n=1 Tax=Bacillus marinisedimentorum TaxID=1821260 RepID=UPI000872B35D|nr:PRC-barrel domain-containing protein [Bacillus marinisedimentorum]